MIRAFLVLFAVLLCVSPRGIAQSHAKTDYYHQHKSAEKYQKHLMKERRKQEKAQRKAEKRAMKAHRKQHR